MKDEKWSHEQGGNEVNIPYMDPMGFCQKPKTSKRDMEEEKRLEKTIRACLLDFR